MNWRKILKHEIKNMPKEWSLKEVKKRINELLDVYWEANK